MGSERIPGKNTKPFGGSSLVEIKLGQLLESKLIDGIVVSSDDPKIADICDAAGWANFHWRDSMLCRNDTSTDALIVHARELMEQYSAEHVLWTHVTSPFVDGERYDEMIQTYFENDDACDSLMSVTKIQSFLWQDGMPLNYAGWAGNEVWPRTQTLTPVYEVNSAAFIAPISDYRRGNRIGERPYMYELDKRTGMDIDWPADFEAAQAAW